MFQLWKTTNKQTSPSNASSVLSHLAEAAFAEDLDKVEVLEGPPLDLSVLPACRRGGRGGRGGGGGGGRRRGRGRVLGSLLVEWQRVLQAIQPCQVCGCRRRKADQTSAKTGRLSFFLSRLCCSLFITDHFLLNFQIRWSHPLLNPGMTQLQHPW